MELKEIQDLAGKTLDSVHPLIKGQYKYKSSLGPVVEAVLRRDWITVGTILRISFWERDFRIMAGSDCLDLSRRLVEDLVAIKFMQQEGSEEQAQIFLGYLAIEGKRELDFLVKTKANLDTELIKNLTTRYESVKEKYRFPDERGEFKNWAGKSIEQMLALLKIDDDEKTNILQSYFQGNLANHMSPSSVQVHFGEDLFNISGEEFLHIGLITTTTNLVSIAILALKELDVPEDTQSELIQLWDSILTLPVNQD